MVLTRPPRSSFAVVPLFVVTPTFFPLALKTCVLPLAVTLAVPPFGTPAALLDAVVAAGLPLGVFPAFGPPAPPALAPVVAVPPVAVEVAPGFVPAAPFVLAAVVVTGLAPAVPGLAAVVVPGLAPAVVAGRAVLLLPGLAVLEAGFAAGVGGFAAAAGFAAGAACLAGFCCAAVRIGNKSRRAEATRLQPGILLHLTISMASLLGKTAGRTKFENDPAL
jgi:hypothetical protein